MTAARRPSIKFLIDLLSRIGEQPVSRVQDLPRRRWKELCAVRVMRLSGHERATAVKSAAQLRYGLRAIRARGAA